MDPLTLIVTALVAGAVAALKDTAGQAVKDVYAALKGLVVARFGSKPQLPAAIAGMESNPTSPGRQQTLREELAAVDAGRDSLVLRQAEVLVDLLRSQGLPAAPSYQADLHGSGAIAQGPGAMAAGERGVVVGGSVSGSTIVTGDGNVAGQGLSAAEVAKLFAAIYQRIEARPEDPAVEKEEIQETVEKIEQEAAKGEQANPSKVERWLKFLAGMAPDIWDVAVATLINPVNGIAEVVRKVAKRAQEEKAGQPAG